MHHRCIGSLIGADNVDLDSLTGTRLHQRHMLMDRRMIDDVWLIDVKHTVEAAAIADRPVIPTIWITAVIPVAMITRSTS